MCGIRDQVAAVFRVVCPQDVKKDASGTGKNGQCQELGSQIRVVRVEGRSVAAANPAMLRRKTNEKWTDKHRNVTRQ